MPLKMSTIGKRIEKWVGYIISWLSSLPMTIFFCFVFLFMMVINEWEKKNRNFFRHFLVYIYFFLRRRRLRLFFHLFCFVDPMPFTSRFAFFSNFFFLQSFWQNGIWHLCASDINASNKNSTSHCMRTRNRERENFNLSLLTISNRERERKCKA